MKKLYYFLKDRLGFNKSTCQTIKISDNELAHLLTEPIDTVNL